MWRVHLSFEEKLWSAESGHLCQSKSKHEFPIWKTPFRLLSFGHLIFEYYTNKVFFFFFQSEKNKMFHINKPYVWYNFYIYILQKWDFKKLYFDIVQCSFKLLKQRLSRIIGCRIIGCHYVSLAVLNELRERQTRQLWVGYLFFTSNLFYLL